MHKLLLFLILFNLGGVPARAVGAPEEGSSTLKGDLFLEMVKPDLIDSTEYTPVKTDKDGKTTRETVKRVKYYYVGGLTDKNIIDQGDYSYIEQIGPRDFRIYTTPFIKRDGVYHEIENADTSVSNWFEQVELDAQAPLSKVIDPLFIETRAQDIFSTDDYAIRCDDTQSPGNQTSCNDAYLSNTDYAPVWYTQWNVARFFLNFDTAGLAGTVESADLHMFQNAQWAPNCGETFYTVPGTQSNPLVPGDYNAYTHDGLDFTPGSCADNAEVIAPVDPAAVVLGSETLLAVVHEDDYNNETSTSGLEGLMYSFHTSRKAGTDYDPYLEISLGGDPIGTSTPIVYTLTFTEGLKLVSFTLAGFWILLAFVFLIWPTKNIS